MTLRVEERAVREHMTLWHSLLAQTRETPVDERVLAWRYLENPHGEARAWVLADSSTSEVAGFTVVMPRRMRLGSRALMAWIGADFSILPRFRALGPALQLRRAAREAIDRGEADLLYAFPNERMMLIHERAGHARLGDLRRVALPASLRPHLQRVLRSRVGAAVLSPPADWAWRAAFALRSMGTSDAVTTMDIARLDESVDGNAHVASAVRITGLRDRSYLQWRYERQPGWRGGVLAASRKGRQTGYLVYTEESGLLQISDLIATDAVAATALIRQAWRIASRRGHASLSHVSLQQGPWEDVFAAMGFRQREEKHAVYAYVPDRHAAEVHARDPARWHLTVGDRDI